MPERLLIPPRVCRAVLRRPIHGAASGDASDSEEELAAFCPTVRVLHKSVDKKMNLYLFLSTSIDAQPVYGSFHYSVLE